MKFDCGPSYAEKLDLKKKPHKWFAWYPVSMEGNPRDCRWLEYVLRTVVLEHWYDGIDTVKRYYPLEENREQEKSNEWDYLGLQ